MGKTQRPKKTPSSSLEFLHVFLVTLPASNSKVVSSPPLLVVMAYSFGSRVLLPANWQRKNPQPCWYRMKQPQFIQNKCVVCYQSRRDCELQFKRDFTVDAFHKSPFPILDSDTFNPMFGYYLVSIPDHHWFHQWNEYGNLKFVFYEEQQETGVSPPSEDERFLFCERLVRKWTEISPSFIAAIE